ncbi:MAG: SDR family NAD(P)-dependent oxidoreductase [Paludibacteraceae bacterium]|nr:SDR family NAD(P)-dependent oxidoreductase [Paludibacteraceae bacterium]
MKTALITGVTSGFGKAFAIRLARSGNYKLIITGRRRERLEEIAEILRRDFNCETEALCFDIRDRESCEWAVQSILESNTHIDVLVNNAGLAAGTSSFDESDTNDFDRMIDTNVKGLLYITKQIVPLMIAQQSGHIVNISSIAGIEVYPNGSVYCASKHAVNAITKGLRIDLVKHGIKVSSISPGMAETEFSVVRYHGDQEKAAAVYKGLIPLSAEDIADALEFILTRPGHVSINDIQINPTQQANTYISHRKQ